MHAESRRVVQRKPTARSRTSNGKVLMEGVDGRSTGARRLHDIISDLTADLGGALTSAQQLQVRTAASLVLHAERLTADMINGKPVDSEELTRVSNGAARLLATLSRQAKPKGKAPTLRDYLAAKTSGPAA